jgi:hypothetical protein
MQPTNQATVELLDKGQFIITRVSEQKIKGRFTMVAFDRFCQAKKIDSYFDLLRKVAVGMSIGDYADLMLFAFQDYYRATPDQCPVKRDDVLEIIDELGGIGEEFMKIILHAVGRIGGGQSKVESEKLKVDSEEIKKQ